MLEIESKMLFISIAKNVTLCYKKNPNIFTVICLEKLFYIDFLSVKIKMNK